jgi:hypothetical protein
MYVLKRRAQRPEQREVTTMKKMTFENTMTYQYIGDRKGAKYTLDGEHFMNHGEYAECLAKFVLGYKAEKDANTRFDKGEDIPELNASVKSWNCGLTDMKLADNKEEFLHKFWEMSNPNVTYIWVYDYAEQVDLWFMTSEEFKMFVDDCATWDEYAKKIRFKLCNNKINAWLEAHR